MSCTSCWRELTPEIRSRAILQLNRPGEAVLRGAFPAISFSGAPSVAATSGFVIESSGARAGKQGLLLYTPNGAGNLPFQGGTLCVSPLGIKRSPAGHSIGGTPGAPCDVLFRVDMNAFASGNAGGNPAAFLNSVGQHVNVQWWGRDTTVLGSLLSNALAYSVCP